jgi:hypothetical protein
MAKASYSNRILHKAAAIVGGERALARYLTVPQAEIYAWMRPGASPPPMAVFFKRRRPRPQRPRQPRRAARAERARRRHPRGSAARPVMQQLDELLPMKRQPGMVRPGPRKGEVAADRFLWRCCFAQPVQWRKLRRRETGMQTTEAYRTLVSGSSRWRASARHTTRRRVTALALLGIVYRVLFTLAAFAVPIALTLAIYPRVWTVTGVVILALLFGVFWFKLRPIPGPRISAAEAPELFAALEALRAKIVAPQVSRSGAGKDFNASAAQRAAPRRLRLAQAGSDPGRAAARERCPRAQLLAVIGHELGHFSKERTGAPATGSTRSARAGRNCTRASGRTRRLSARPSTSSTDGSCRISTPTASRSRVCANTRPTRTRRLLPIARARRRRWRQCTPTPHGSPTASGLRCGAWPATQPDAPADVPRRHRRCGTRRAARRTAIAPA